MDIGTEYASQRFILNQMNKIESNLFGETDFSFPIETRKNITLWNYLPNLDRSLTKFKLGLHSSGWRLASNESEKCNYNPNLVKFNNKSIREDTKTRQNKLFSA